MSQNTRDGVEGVLRHGLSHLNPDHNTPVTKWVNQSENIIQSPPPIKKIILSRLQSPPFFLHRFSYKYNDTRSDGGGGWDGMKETTSLSFPLFLTFEWMS